MRPLVWHLLAAGLLQRRISSAIANHLRIAVPSVSLHKIGILPSLEVVPFFEEEFLAASNIGFVARSSYGSIARDMLTGILDGGVLPWEIFTSDVLALPGQRTQWDVPFFPHACATELALRTPVHKSLCSKSAARKSPSRLVIGVESRNSLTRAQWREWLRGLGKSPQPEVEFKFLPMDLMLQAMAADAIDGFIAPSPWGLIAEEKQLGILDSRFKPGAFAQQIVIANRKSQPLAGLATMRELAGALTRARSRLADPGAFEKAACRMSLSGKPVIQAESLSHAVRHHASSEPANDELSDVAKLTRELLRLESFAALPPQIAPTEQTAMLLLPS
jgi:hypothetical protein